MFDLGFGWSFLFADVGNASPAPSPALQLSYGLSIRQSIMPYLSVSLDFSTGKFYGEQALGDSANINYQTSVINQGLRFTYEASHLFVKNKNGFSKYQPYLGFGVGLISFRAKGDLKDENQNVYNYWSDGSIRNLPESAGNVDQAIIISRDHVYESNLRDANLDGFGRYDQMALRIPIELGFRYQFTKRIGAHVKGTYNLNFTDLLDNVTSESLGDREGNTANDNHISAMLGVSVYLGEYKKPKRKNDKRELQPSIIAEERVDSIGDTTGLTTESDSIDAKALSELADSELNGEKVDKTESNPAEKHMESGNTDETVNLMNDSNIESKTTDNSLEEDSLNSERTVENHVGEVKSISENNEEVKATDDSEESHLDSSENRSINVLSPNTEELASESSLNSTESQNNSLPAIDETDSSTSTSEKDNATQSIENEVDNLESTDKSVAEMTTMDLIDKTMNIESTEPKLAGTYHWADVNKDKYISADEVLYFIDLLFDGESEYTVPMIHELIEYYFDQD